MGLSRSTKISVLLAVTCCMFVVELSVGYIVGSLALVADAYHMLNDVMSLVIALYAIKLSKRSASAKYTYGWHRAEVLAALVNGVFLCALCFSIFMEAIERFVHPSEIQDPKLVVIVGSIGLACNIGGLLLFHEHGHSHGHGHGSSTSPTTEPSAGVTSPETPAAGGGVIPLTTQTSRLSRHTRDSIQSLYGHPAQTRQAVVQEAEEYCASEGALNGESLDAVERGEANLFEILAKPPPESPAAGATASQTVLKEKNENEIPVVSQVVAEPAEPAKKANHSESKKRNSGHAHGHGHGHEHGHGHSHGGEGSMNIRGVVLHVFGDALGSLGVVVSGLIIWLTPLHWRFYFDPLLSVVIVIIILCSAVPLVRSAAFILLQGVPSSVSLSQICTDIAAVPGVLSVHDLHVWQLSETKMVASVHIMVSKAHPYMDVGREVTAIFHRHGIHSGTVQPEVVDDAASGTGSDKTCLIACSSEALCVEICAPPNATLTPIREH